MTDPADSTALLTALQHGDSFFPGGGFAASWGLETLFTDSYVHDAETLLHFVQGQLHHRWACCDRPALVWAHRAAGELEKVAVVDAELEALSLARELRVVSQRAGRALLRVHDRLKTPRAADYLERVKTGQAWSHLPVVQGLVWRGVGLDAEQASSAVRPSPGHGVCECRHPARLCKPYPGPTDCAADTPHADRAACHALTRVSQQLYAGRGYCHDAA